jgi:hypothetical protein
MKIRLLPVLMLVLWAGLATRCGSDAGQPDASVWPDAEAGPDAAAIPPDATILPDAALLVPDTGPRLCDPSQCAAGNICVQNRCMLQCMRHTDCPDGYDCRSTEGKLVCVANGMPYGHGMFGYGCGAPTAQCAAGFVCVGPKNDPNSYCTRSPCVDDTECPGNYFCTGFDQTLTNVDAGMPDVGGNLDTGYHPPPAINVRACIKRGYCAPATGVVDCDSSDAIYARDSQSRGWCLRGCSGLDPNGCGGGNQCVKTPSGYQCWPRALTCAPGGGFCSRCYSSDDCPKGGFCYYEPFTKEQYCTSPCQTAADCTYSKPVTGQVPGECDATLFSGKQCFPEAPADPSQPASCWYLLQ